MVKTDGQTRAIISTQQAEINGLKQQLSRLKSDEYISRLLDKDRRLEAENALLKAAQPLIMQRNRLIKISESDIFKAMQRLIQESQDVAGKALAVAVTIGPWEGALREITGI